MKIVHIISSFCVGGAEIFVVDLAKEMIKENQVEIWTLNSCENKEFEKQIIIELEKNNIGYKIFDKRRGKDKLKTIFSIRKELNKFNPDLVNTHLQGVSFYVMLASLFSKIKIIQTIHNTVIKHRAIQRILGNIMLEKYICISNETKNQLINQCCINEKKCEIVLNGININKYYVAKRELKENVETIISIGRLTEAKGHDNLLFAYAQLINKLKEKQIEIPELLIVGDGELKEYLSNLINELKLNKYVKLLGIRSDISTLLSTSDIYIMPSRWEGLSISLIEASISKIPIIATDVGSNSDIINDKQNGILIPKDDIESISNSLLNLIISYDMRKEIVNNGEINLLKFNIEITADNYLAVYKSVLNI